MSHKKTKAFLLTEKENKQKMLRARYIIIIIEKKKQKKKNITFKKRKTQKQRIYKLTNIFFYIFI